LGNKTPEEVFIRKKPKVNHLSIFGCPMYIHVPKEKRVKLEPSEKKGTFVGYSETSKELKDFCREARIKKELTTPYNPQQNGVAERKNRSIVEATKAMIHGRSIQYNCICPE
jgi:hypothetical protein